MTDSASSFDYNYNLSTGSSKPLQQQTTAPQSLAERYRVTKKVGDGTFGEVSLAKKLDTGDLVAIKRFYFYLYINSLVFKCVKKIK